MEEMVKKAIVYDKKEGEKKRGLEKEKEREREQKG